MKEFVEQAVIGVIHSLREKYDNLNGLCDLACKMLMAELQPDFECHVVHGELKHNSRILSTKWSIQHSWLEVSGNTILYVDPTSSQFVDLFPEIPEYYISEEPPIWYYPDSENPAWKTKNKLLHELIEIFQYDIHGTFSDVVYRLKKRGG